MLAAFGDRAGDSLGDRLIAALQAGLAAGGEVSPSGRPDAHRGVGALAGHRAAGRLAQHHRAACRLWQLWQPQAETYVGRALRPGINE
jgi:hypothetical protein